MPTAQLARRYEVVSRDSFMKIRTHSDIHDINGKGIGITGHLDAAFGDGVLIRDVGIHMHVTIPVVQLSSGNRVQDEQMHGLISSKAFPNIEAELISALATGKPNEYKISGSVQVKGTSKLVTGEIDIRESAGRVEILGKRDFDIRMFRIEPPRFLGFTIDPNVFVELRIVAAAVDS